MTDNRTIITPPNEAAWLALRARNINSTESPALFDMSPYLTNFELWHRLRNNTIVELPENERMKWGKRLQDAIAAGIAEDQGWLAEPMKEYISLNDVRMGSSFDFRMIAADGRLGVFEIKNVDFLVFREQWTRNDDGTYEAPAHIEIQLQHQLHVSGYEFGAIGVLVAGNQPFVIIRERDAEVGAAIEQRIRDFWKTVDAGIEPPPQFPDDAKFVASLYQYAEPGKVFDGRGDAELATLAAEYRRAADAEKLAGEDKEVAKAKLLAKIGDAEKALLDGYSISAGVVGPAQISYERKAYRSFRLTAKKAAKAA